MALSRKSRSHAAKHTRTQVGRFYIVFGAFVLLALAIVGKTLYIQVVDSGNLAAKARQARNHSLVLFNRGRILDRHGVIMAQDKVLYDLYAHPQFFWKIQPHEIAKALSPFLEKPVKELRRQLSRSRSTIKLAKNLDKAIVDTIRTARIERPVVDNKTNIPVVGDDGVVMMSRVPIPGMDYVKKSVRAYPQGTLAAHVLGYVNDEADLQSGVEESAKETLKQAPAEMPSALEVDGRGNPISPEYMTSKQVVTVPQADDVVLTVDSRIQFIAERALAEGLERTKAKRGAVIMMEPDTGAILAFAVRPTYNPEQFLKAAPQVLKNWALSDVYPPGSVFKILTLACGLETQVINEQSRIHDTGKMRVGGWTITNYDYYRRGAPGSIDLVYLLAHSSNIASAKIALMMEPKAHWKLLRALGFGQHAGIDLPGESQGILLPVEKWDEATHASLGYGYGVAATPVQMIAAINTIANGGKWVTPHIIQSPESKVNERQVLRPETAKLTTELLAKSIEASKYHPLHDFEGIRVAGKTGTSRRPNEAGTGYGTDLYTSFVGFYPAEHPKVVMLVVVDSPGIGEAWGSTVAAPIFKAVASETLHFIGLQPGKPSDS